MQSALWIATLLVSLHSLLLGSALLFCPKWFLAATGWPYLERAFFPSQAGVFLILLSFAYFLGLKYRAMVRFIILSKIVALAFLLFHFLFLNAPRVVLPTAILDGSMGLVLWVLYLANTERPD